MDQVTAPGAQDQPVRAVAVRYLLVAVAGALFGGIDQYLGSLYSPLLTTFSLMSAPWVLLPFCIGCTQTRPRRAVLMALAGTVAAVLGYCVMILSPVEGVHNLGARVIFAVVWSQTRWLLAALIAGPLYGYLGQRWRTERSRLSAVLAISPLVLEPVLPLIKVEQGQSAAAYLAELAVGAVFAAYFMTSRLRGGSGEVIEDGSC